MLSITNTCKQLLNNDKRNYAIKIEMTLSDNTTLVIENDDIWEGGLSIDSATSNSDSFDIGCAIIGKCSVILNNITENFSDYNFYSARFTLKLGVVGDNLTDNSQRYYQIGVYTVDTVTYNGSLITLDCLDNMWKLDVPFSEVTGISYPIQAGQIVTRIINHCGWTGGFSFNNSWVYIPEIPDKTLNCREVLQYVAQITCNYIKILPSGQISLHWYSKSPTSYAEIKNTSSSNVSPDEIVVTGAKVVYSDDNGEHEVLSIDSTLEQTYPRYLLCVENNPFIKTEEFALDVAGIVGNGVKGYRLRQFNASALNMFHYTTGDPCKITDFRGNEYTSYITNLKFTTNNYETFSCGVTSPTESLTTRYSDTVRTSVETKVNARQILTEYDTAVKGLNELSQQALGYNKYEYTTDGGGTITWLYSGSNIDTTNPANPKFDDSTNVFKISGQGVFISTDGGTTYDNGYDANSGTAILNLIYSHGISCDWIRAGTLSLGGTNNVNGIAEVYNASGSLVTKLDNNGIQVNKGTISGCDVDILRDGSLDIYSDDQKSNLVGTVNKDGITLKDNNNKYFHISSSEFELGTSSSNVDFSIYRDTLRNVINSRRDLNINVDGFLINGNEGMNTSIDVVTNVYSDGSTERATMTFTNGILTGFDWIN